MVSCFAKTVWFDPKQTNLPSANDTNKQPVWSQLNWIIKTHKASNPLCKLHETSDISQSTKRRITGRSWYGSLSCVFRRAAEEGGWSPQGWLLRYQKGNLRFKWTQSCSAYSKREENCITQHPWKPHKFYISALPYLVLHCRTLRQPDILRVNLMIAYLLLFM